jgi:hypothetical protein
MSPHKKISFLKSSIRIVGYVFGFLAFVDSVLATLAFTILIVSEVIGVIEEFGEK